MKAYIYTKDSELNKTAYTSLKECCEAAGVKYASASRGKRMFIQGETCTKIHLISIKQFNRKKSTVHQKSER